MKISFLTTLSLLGLGATIVRGHEFLRSSGIDDVAEDSNAAHLDHFKVELMALERSMATSLETLTTKVAALEIANTQMADAETVCATPITDIVTVGNHNVHHLAGRGSDFSSEGTNTVWHAANITKGDGSHDGIIDVIGTSQGSCIQTSTDLNNGWGRFINCILTLSFDGRGGFGVGSVMLQGGFDGKSEPLSVLAVTGGTGMYKGASGSSTLRFVYGTGFVYGLDVCA